MPMFEFLCKDCGYMFEKIQKKSEDSPSCPACGSNNVQKGFSQFATVGSSSSSLSSSAGCNSGG